MCACKKMTNIRYLQSGQDSQKGNRTFLNQFEYKTLRTISFTQLTIDIFQTKECQSNISRFLCHHSRAGEFNFYSIVLTGRENCSLKRIQILSFLLLVCQLFDIHYKNKISTTTFAQSDNLLYFPNLLFPIFSTELRLRKRNIGGNFHDKG